MPFQLVLEQSAAKNSLARIYSRQFLFIFKDIGKGLELSFEVHPIWLLFLPLVRVLRVFEVLRGLKKLHNSNPSNSDR